MLLSTFGGEVPRSEPRLLDAQQAVKAVNVNLERGSLASLQAPGKVASLSSPVRTLFKHPVDGWLSYAGIAHVVPSAVLDIGGETPLGHTLVTVNGSPPRQRLAGGHECRLGLPRPSQAPQISVNKGGALGTTVHGFAASDLNNLPARYGNANLPPLLGDETANVQPMALATSADEISRSTTYCYTLMRSLAGGVIQQESAPSPASEVMDVKVGDGVTISGFTIPSGDDYAVSHIRLYRSVSGNATSEFRFVAEFAVNQTSYDDNTPDKDVSTEVLRTSLWDAIPDDAQGLIKTDNGLYAAFRGNELLISEPFFPYAFPAAYRLTVENRIVALAHIDSTIVVLTEGRPYLAQGGVPESLQLVHLPIEQACVSALSVGSLPGGVVYASPDGLMLFGTGEQTLITASLFTREQWQNLGPERLMGTVHDGRYLGFFAGSNQGLIVDLGRRDVVRVQFPDDWQVNAVYHHSADDAVYLACSTPEGNGVWRCEGGDPLPFVWRSRPLCASALTGMGCLRIEGDQTPETPLEVRVLGGEAGRIKTIMTIGDNRARRLPPLRSEKVWAVEIAGVSSVREVRLGGSIEEVERGR